MQRGGASGSPASARARRCNPDAMMMIAPEKLKSICTSPTGIASTIGPDDDRVLLGHDDAGGRELQRRLTQASARSTARRTAPAARGSRGDADHANAAIARAEIAGDHADCRGLALLALFGVLSIFALACVNRFAEAPPASVVVPLPIHDHRLGDRAGLCRVRRRASMLFTLSVRSSSLRPDFTSSGASRCGRAEAPPPLHP